jgi:hypothetical protein
MADAISRGPIDEPRIEPDSVGFPELARFERGELQRVYELRPVDGGAELWRITQSPGAPSESVNETTFRSTTEALEFLAELDRTLKAAGWRAV